MGPAEHGAVPRGDGEKGGGEDEGDMMGAPGSSDCAQAEAAEARQARVGDLHVREGVVGDGASPVDSDDELEALVALELHDNGYAACWRYRG